MKKILIIALSFLMNFALLALSPEAKYNDAHTAFKTNDFQNAANLYRQMVDEDSIVSADVYYNLANAYYRLNDFSSAILFYHKTLKLDADYVDAAYNLRLAERNLEDKIEPVPQLFYIRWYRSLCAYFSTDSWAWMFCITFFVAIICLIFFAKSKKTELRKVFFLGSMALLFSAVLALSLAWSSFQNNEAKQRAVVFAGSVSVKSSPVQSAMGLFIIHAGTTVEITDELGEWVKVKLEDGKEGWMIFGDLERI